MNNNPNLQPLAVIKASNVPNLPISWSSDSCNDGRHTGPPTIVGGACVDDNGNPVVLNSNRIFPNGFTTFSLQRGFGDAQVVTDLMNAVGFTNNNVNVGVTRLLTLPISNGARFPSGYYRVVMTATDAGGFQVSGGSVVFAIDDGVTPLPTANTISLVSPLKGSYWIAGATYRIRWEILPVGPIPDLFNVDLLLPNKTFIAPLIVNTLPLANDTLFGSKHLLNYTVWTIPTALHDRRLRIRLTGVFSLGGVPQPITSANPVETSDVIAIGPVAPTSNAPHSRSLALVGLTLASLTVCLL